MRGQGLVVFGLESRRTALLRGHSQHSMAAFLSMVIDGFGLVLVLRMLPTARLLEEETSKCKGNFKM